MFHASIAGIDRRSSRIFSAAAKFIRLHFHLESRTLNSKSLSAAPFYTENSVAPCGRNATLSQSGLNRIWQLVLNNQTLPRPSSNPRRHSRTWIGKRTGEWDRRRQKCEIWKAAYRGARSAKTTLRALARAYAREFIGIEPRLSPSLSRTHTHVPDRFACAPRRPRASLRDVRKRVYSRFTRFLAQHRVRATSPSAPATRYLICFHQTNFVSFQQLSVPNVSSLPSLRYWHCTWPSRRMLVLLTGAIT